MSAVADRRFSFLPPAAARLGAALARPKAIAGVCIVVLAGAGWASLGLDAAGMGTIGTLCTVQGGAPPLAAAMALWVAMVLAMMLPSAAPMILTYADIADTAARKGERIVSPLVFVAGYVAVWLGFALVAVFAQNLAAALAGEVTTAARFATGALFVMAGLYQFSALKHACLHRCRSPLSFFFAHWRTTAAGVFRLGTRQGLYCLGCCWALMLLMGATGLMNVAWMAGLGIFMTLEKTTRGRALSRAAGAALIVAGAALVAMGILAYGGLAWWPLRTN